MSFINSRFPSFFLIFVLYIFSGFSIAEEMDHSKPGGGNMKGMEGMEGMSGDHDTATSAMHIHHGQGAGGFMFEYKIMRMEMDGLLRGSDSVSTQSISGASMPGPTNNSNTTYMMSPTAMTMNMHMFMAMYGINDKLSIMGMVHYLSNDMDMVMHMVMPSGMAMTNPDGSPADMFGSMDTSGVGDTRVDAMYNAGSGLTASLGISLPTGSIDEKVTMQMTNPVTGMNGPLNSDIQAPYTMQLGSGTIDLIPSVTYSKNFGDWTVGGQANYTLRTGDNDNGYTLGDILKITGWGKYSVNSNLTVSGRLNIMDWDKIDGVDSQIPVMLRMMAPTLDAVNSGGSRVDLLFGVSGHFGMNHMVSFEFGVPIQQDLDGVQMETDTLISVGYQYMMM